MQILLSLLKSLVSSLNKLTSITLLCAIPDTNILVRESKRTLIFNFNTLKKITEFKQMSAITDRTLL